MARNSHRLYLEQVEQGIRRIEHAKKKHAVMLKKAEKEIQAPPNGI